MVHRAPSVILARVESRAPTEFVALRAERERRERTVSQVLRETWVSKETGVRSACWEPVERMDLRALRAGRAPTESLVPWVWLERRVSWVSRDYQATQEDKDPRAPAVSLGSPEPTARKEPGAWRANPVQGGSEVQRVHVADAGQGVRQASQALRAHRATMDHQAGLAREDLKDPRAQLVSLDRKAPLDHLERTGCPDTLASAEKRDSKERPALPALVEWWVPRDPLERPALSAREATLDPRARLESRVFPVPLAKREQRETQDPREQPARTVPRACEGSPESEVYPAPRVQRV